jgi:hypothetical protein
MRRPRPRLQVGPWLGIDLELNSVGHERQGHEHKDLVNKKLRSLLRRVLHEEYEVLGMLRTHENRFFELARPSEHRQPAHQPHHVSTVADAGGYRPTKHASRPAGGARHHNYDPHPEEYNPNWSPKWLFLGGFHHSGTSLVERALSENAQKSLRELPRENCTAPCWGALVTGHQQNEGQWEQSVFPTGVDRRDSRECHTKWSEPLCPPLFPSPSEAAASKLQSQWRRYHVGWGHGPSLASPRAPRLPPRGLPGAMSLPPLIELSAWCAPMMHSTPFDVQVRLAYGRRGGGGEGS